MNFKSNLSVRCGGGKITGTPAKACIDVDNLRALISILKMQLIIALVLLNELI
jgi:hypothetical protein